MRKALIAAMSAVLLCGFQGDASRKWEPGDRCVLYTLNSAGTDLSRVWLLNGLFAWEACEKALLAKDDAGLNQLAQRDQLTEIQSGTKAQVIEFHKAYNIGDESTRDAWEVRVLDGEHAGKAGWVLEDAMRRVVTVLGEGITAAPGPEGYGKAVLASDRKVVLEIYAAVGKELDTVKGAAKRNRRILANRNRRIVQKLNEIAVKYERPADDITDLFDYAVDHGWLAKEPGPKAEPKAKPVAAKSASMFRVATALERTNKGAAIEMYQDIIDLHPDSPEAGPARMRIAALRKK